MTTLRTLVSDALRESGLIQLGTDPEAAEHEEGLRRLQVIIRSLIGHELGENLEDVTFGRNGLTSSHTYEDWTDILKTNYVPANVRLILNLEEAETIYLHPSPRDGARLGVVDNLGNLATYNLTVNANGRQIEDAGTATLATDSLIREWFYRADLGDWTRITDLTADDESPFPFEFDDLLITMLAMRLNPRYGEAITQETVAAMNRSKSQFRSRYRQNMEMNSELALTRIHPWQTHWEASSNDRFNSGRP
jgi:hypothetical protein